MTLRVNDDIAEGVREGVAENVVEGVIEGKLVVGVLTTVDANETDSDILVVITNEVSMDELCVTVVVIVGNISSV